MRPLNSASFYELEQLAFHEANNGCVLNWVLCELLRRPRDIKKERLVAQVRELIEELDALKAAFAVIGVDELLDSAKAKHQEKLRQYHFESSGGSEEYDRHSEQEKAFETIASIKNRRTKRALNRSFAYHVPIYEKAEMNASHPQENIGFDQLQMIMETD